MTITPKGSSFMRSVVSQYTSPSNIGISNSSFTPNDQAAFGLKTPTTYTRILGNFDPAGIWKFSGIDIRTDAGIDAIVVYKIVLKWSFRDSVEICDIPLCNNKSKILDAGIPDANYIWTNGDKVKTISTSKEGIIGVTVTKNNRTSSHSVNLVLTNTHFSQQKSICEGSSLKVGKKFYSKAGTYIDTLISQYSCDSILTTVLEVRPITRTNETLFKCHGDKFNLITLIKDTSISLISLGQNNCDSIHTINFVVNPEIKANFNYDKKCNNAGTELSVVASGGTNNFNLQWITGDTSTIISSVKSGNYSLTITDSKSCQHIFNTIVLNYDSVAVAETIKDVLCFGDKNGEIKIDVLAGTSPFNYNWSTGNQTTTLSDLFPGKYTVIIFDANGCRFESQYEVKSPDLLFVIGDAIASYGNNGSIDLMVSGGTKSYNFFWSNGETTQKIMNLIPGTYTVTVTDANSCMNVQTFEVQNKVSVKDQKKSNEITILPNPAINEINIKSNNQLIKEVELRNIKSQLILNKKSILEYIVKLNISELPSGQYILTLKLNNGNQIQRIIVKSE
ncbi:MAG: T9SS type A sorting domain-containing protein, partial [Saprospiraceae bacterium]